MVDVWIVFVGDFPIYTFFTHHIDSAQYICFVKGTWRDGVRFLSFIKRDEEKSKEFYFGHSFHLSTHENHP